MILQMDDHTYTFKYIFKKIFITYMDTFMSMSNRTVKKKNAS